MSKRVYIATLEVEIIVVASSPKAAQKAAHRALADEIINEEDFLLSNFSHLPGQYATDIENEEEHVASDVSGEYITVLAASKMHGGYASKEPIAGI